MFVVSCDTGSEPVADVCTECAVGTYKAVNGTDPCTACPEGQITDLTGSTTAADCKGRPITFWFMLNTNYRMVIWLLDMTFSKAACFIQRTFWSSVHPLILHHSNYFLCVYFCWVTDGKSWYITIGKVERYQLVQSRSYTLVTRFKWANRR